MVERIITAGRGVLVKDGYDAFSTNRVATAAGISPGSLYQYFPDKAAVLDVVIDRYWEQVAESVAASLTDRIGSVGVDAVRDTADALVAALEVDPALLRVMAEELPLARNKARRTVLEKRVSDLASIYFAARPETSRRPSPAITAWVLVISLEALATRWVLDQPSALGREQLLEEMVALVMGYLQP
ncbi:TetR family transcriptional regulator [Nocardioides sp. Root614]|nr:TetR family transcriptional regulator [Nocardioides sp. Root614]KRA88049.1 TetR family transcriptional regulator [Nocardioides sp. Root682]